MLLFSVVILYNWASGIDLLTAETKTIYQFYNKNWTSIKKDQEIIRQFYLILGTSSAIHKVVLLNLLQLLRHFLQMSFNFFGVQYLQGSLEIIVV